MKRCFRALAKAAAGVFLLPMVQSSAAPQVVQVAQGTSGLQVQGNEVLLDVIAHDKRNRPVLDLKAEQVAITDNGVPVNLTEFRLVNGSQQDEPLITLLFDRPVKQNPEESNDDLMNGFPGPAERDNGKKVRDAAANFLKAFPSTGFRFAVMDIWGRLQLQKAYTEDRRAITEGISSATEPGEPGVKGSSNALEEQIARVAQTGQDASGEAVSTKDRALSRSMFAAMQTSAKSLQDPQMSPLLACLQALVESQQSLPGRKAVVYFTEGADDAKGASAAKLKSDNHARQAIQSLTGAANRAGVNIFVVRLSELDDSKKMRDLLEVYSTMSFGSQDLRIKPATAGSPAVDGYQMVVAGQFGSNSAFRSIAAQQSVASGQREWLEELAKDTGGLSLNTAENLAAPLKEMVRDLTTYYEAGYVPPAGEDDGSFHATEVKTLRTGLKVSTRTGYLALPRNAGTDEPPQGFELPLMAMLKRADAPANVEYRATVLHIDHEQEGDVNLLALEAPVKGIEVHEDTSTHLLIARLSVLAYVKDSTGTVIERFSEDIDRRWSAESGTGGNAEYISFERSFTASPGNYVLETAVLDKNSGKGAVQREAFEIGVSPSLPEMSTLVLVRGMEPLDVEHANAEPLKYGDHRVEPNLYGELPEGVHNVSVFFVAHTDSQSKEAATVKLQVLQGDRVLGGAPLTSTLQDGVDLHSVINQFSINTTSGGRFRIRATLTQGGKSAETVSDLVLPGEVSDEESGSASDAAMLSDGDALTDQPLAADRPAAEALNGVLEDARRNSMDYRKSLPNLACEQTTRRSTSSSDGQDWQHQDTIVELLTYVDQEENRTPVMQEELGKIVKPKDHEASGMISAGEFGDALVGIFRPDSKAEFNWRESATLRGEAVEVFEYAIATADSTFSLQAASGIAKVGYHGRIFVDRATHGVRRVTLITDEAPKTFPIRKAAVRVDYDYVGINEHDYLLPLSAEVVVSEGKQTLERNDLEFSNFRRFGSTLRIVDDGARKSQ